MCMPWGGMGAGGEKLVRRYVIQGDGLECDGSVDGTAAWCSSTTQARRLAGKAPEAEKGECNEKQKQHGPCGRRTQW